MAELLRNIRSSHTFRLRKGYPTFVEGIVALLEVDGSLQDKYNTDPTDEQADANSLVADWKAVGEDMNVALKTYAGQHP